ncbi:YbaB/EbfC family nucleoid-associated protein [Actinophytocola sp. NPDC049390]|uniref:YbaB/EbfC family nucleoid-associated protein n=1 Tax=Actinophytocola sp. NPDC049390 TaxID=3363894 RepID=UPI0037BBD213
MDPEQLIAGLEQDIEKVRRQANAVQDGLGAVRVTERSDDGQIAVTVNATGNVVELRLGDGPRAKQGQELAQEILHTMRRAQSRLADAVHDRLADTAPEATLAAMDDQYRTTYPRPRDEPKERKRSTLRIGAEEDLSAARPRPSRPGQRPDEAPDFGDRNLLR